MKKFISLLLLTCTLALCLTACGNNESGNNEDKRVKITESVIQSALADYEGTLTIEGPSDDVTSFTYVVNDINATKLVDKSYTRKAVNILLEDWTKITYGEYQVAKAFSVTASIMGIFASQEGEFDASAYVEEALSVICDGNVKTYGDWKISSSIDADADSITIVAKRK
jgi:hypothetical protein